MNQDQQQERREQFWRDGWNVGRDDDTPGVPELPEPCPMASGQARRAWRTDQGN
jgi:hypothetical protein